MFTRSPHMTKLLSALLGLALLGTAFADDKKDDKKDDKAPAVTGKWVREADGFEMAFTFKKDTLVLDATAGDHGVVVTASYKADAEGKYACEITDVKEKGTFPTKPEKGTKFSFKFKAKDKVATLSDFELPDADGARAVVEGEYKKKSD
jgi:hypothetical protein